LTVRTLAEKGGEETHAMSSTELLAHTHSSKGQAVNYASTGTNPSMEDQSSGGGSTYATASTGSNAAMNEMPPYGVTMFIIRT
jgi:microcystin-dependent protein